MDERNISPDGAGREGLLAQVILERFPECMLYGLDGFAAFERMRWNTYLYFDPEHIDKPSRLLDQLKWLELAGFVDVDVYWMRAGHAIFGGWVIK